MLNRTKMLALVIVLVAAASPAMGQTCLLGVYADDAGNLVSSYLPTEAQVFEIVVAIDVESTVAGVSYTLSLPAGVLQVGEPLGNDPVFGPNGLGLRVGDNVGLGECAIGFNGNRIAVERFSAVVFVPQQVVPLSQVTLSPATGEATPLYADCANNLLACEGSNPLTIEGVISNDAESFGAIKSLYSN